MIDGQPDRDGLFTDALFADFSQQGLGAKVETAATFGDGHDACSEVISALGL